jgi:tetratricopeptide (TPR) repeat protein
MAKHPRSNPAPASDSSDATKKTLGSLGYLAGGARKAPLRDAPDPKDRLAEYQSFDRALDALYSQRFDDAIRGFLAVLAQNRKNLPARDSLADAYLRAGKPEEAVRQWTAALAEDPDYAPAAQALGEHYMKQQAWSKARPYFQQALAAAPKDFTLLYELGAVERKLGLFTEAAGHLRTACDEKLLPAACSELREAERGRPQ